MRNILVILTLVSTLTLSGCTLGKTAEQSDNTQNQGGITGTSGITSNGSNQITSNNSYLDKDAFKKSYVPFTMQDSAIYASLFQINDTSLVFPNWDDNNNISIVNEPYPKDVVNTSNINDFVNYSAYSLSVINNIVYFSDGTNNSSLSSVDLSNKAYTQVLPNAKVYNIIGSNNIIYFIDGNNENKLHSFNTTNNVQSIICNDNVGRYLVDEDVILYENKSDNSTLYKINIDGTQKEKLSDFAVNSFAPYSGEILAINSSDNNNLYSINLNDLSTKRLGVMNGEDLKIFNGQLYFINVSDNRQLSTMTVDLTQSDPQVTFKNISDDAINEYYPTDKGVFAQKGINVNNGYVLISSEVTGS